MTQADFLPTLEQEFQLRGTAFSRADLLAFVADAWPLIVENPDVTHWARGGSEARRIMRFSSGASSGGHPSGQSSGKRVRALSHRTNRQR